MSLETLNILIETLKDIIDENNDDNHLKENSLKNSLNDINNENELKMEIILLSKILEKCFIESYDFEMIQSFIKELALKLNNIINNFDINYVEDEIKKLTDNFFNNIQFNDNGLSDVNTKKNKNKKIKNFEKNNENLIDENENLKIKINQITKEKKEIEEILKKKNLKTNNKQNEGYENKALKKENLLVFKKLETENNELKIKLENNEKHKEIIKNKVIELQKGYSDEIDRLKNHIENLGKKILEFENKQFKNTILEKDANMNIINNENIQLKIDIDKKEKKLKDLNFQLNNILEENNKVKNININLKESQKELINKSNELELNFKKKIDNFENIYLLKEKKIKEDLDNRIIILNKLKNNLFNLKNDNLNNIEKSKQEFNELKITINYEWRNLKPINIILDRLKLKLKDKEWSINKLLENQKYYKNNLKSKEDKLDVWIKEKNHLSVDLKLLNEKNISNKSEYIFLENSLNEIKFENKKLNSEILNSENIIKDLNFENKNLSEKIQEYKQEKLDNSVKDKSTYIENEIKYKSIIENNKESMKNLDNLNNSLYLKINDLNKVIRNKDNIIKENHEEFLKIEKKLSEFEQNLKEKKILKDEIFKLKMNLNKKILIVDDYIVQNSSLRNEIKNLNSKIVDLNEFNKVEKEKYYNKIQNIDGSHDLVINLKNEIQNLNHTIKDIKSKSKNKLNFDGKKYENKYKNMIIYNNYENKFNTIDNKYKNMRILPKKFN